MLFHILIPINSKHAKSFLKYLFMSFSNTQIESMYNDLASYQITVESKNGNPYTQIEDFVKEYCIRFFNSYEFSENIRLGFTNLVEIYVLDLHHTSKKAYRKVLQIN